jgi:hypothetical protein
MRQFVPVAEAPERLGGISSTKFYALVKEGEPSFVRSATARSSTPEELDDFFRRRRYDPSSSSLRPPTANIPCK